MTSLETIVGLAQKHKEMLLNGQLNLFGTQEKLFGLANGNSMESTNGSSKEIISEYSQKEMQLMEKELTGFYISSHPLENIPEIIERFTTCNLVELSEIPDNTEVLVIAVVNEVNKKLTKNNKIIGILQLEDMIGKVEAVVFSDQLAQFGEFILPETTLIILGRVQQKSEGTLSLQIKAVHPLEEIKILSIQLPEEIVKNNDAYTTIHSVRSILQKQKQNSFYPAIIQTKDKEKRTYILDRKYWSEPDENLIKNLSQLSQDITVEITSPFKQVQTNVFINRSTIFR